MSQDSILNLMKPKKWYCVKDFVPVVPFNESTISRNFNRLVKFRVNYSLDYRKGKRNKVYLCKK